MDVSEKNMFPMIDKAISEPLTDNRTADALKDNTEGLLAAGIEPDMAHLRYIKLNRFEQREQAYKELCENFIADLKSNSVTMNDLVESLRSIRASDLTPEPTIEVIKATEEEVTKPTAIIRGQRRNAIAIEDAIFNLEDTKCK